jgi:23S rRNA pseudouridine1911/1915/1917 synthase
VIVAERAGVSRSRAAAWIKEGRVTLRGEVQRRASATVIEGDEVQFEAPPLRADRAVPQDLPLRIVHEDAHLAVIDKAPGMVVHPSPGHPDGTLVNALLHHLDGLSGIGGVERPGIVHRLDKGTSGLLVVAKHDEAHQSLAAQFADKSAGRVYLALCLGQPEAEQGTVRSWLGRHPTDRLRWCSQPEGVGKHAVTHWAVEARAGTVTLVRCWLETGRTHQVRVHLSEQGWPLAGDATYKRRGKRPPARLAPHVDPEGQRPLLHAWQLSLTHPATGERCTWSAPPPDDYAAALQALEIDPQRFG